MSEDPMKVPLPIIIFLSSLLACLIILCIIYQLLKRDKCCQIHGREGGDEEEIQPFITEENENQETGQADTTADNTAEDIVAINSSAVEQTDGAERADDTTIDLSLSGASFPSINLLPLEEEEPVSTSGSLLLETTFSPVAKKMTISVVRAADIPGPDRGGTSMVQVHLTILPNRRFKFRTSLKPAESPVFNEKFSLYPVTVETLEEMSIRVRLYGKTRFSKKVLGELEILFTEIDLHSDLSDEPMWKTLLPYGMVAPKPRPKSSASAEGESVKSLPDENPPELQISLHYISRTGRLKVEVIKARNLLKIMGSASQATHVHILYLSPTGDYEAQSSTKRRKGPDPEFNETFIFTLGHDEIPQASMTLSVKIGSRVIGWFALGRNFSGSREERHWKKLSEISDVTLRQWQKLLGVG